MELVKWSDSGFGKAHSALQSQTAKGAVKRGDGGGGGPRNLSGSHSALDQPSGASGERLDSGCVLSIDPILLTG